jgi:hypothetical protein
MTTQLNDTLRDLGIGVGGPAGGLIIANAVSDPVVANISIAVGIIAGVSVIVKNVLDIWKNHFK